MFDFLMSDLLMPARPDKLRLDGSDFFIRLLRLVVQPLQG